MQMQPSSAILIGHRGCVITMLLMILCALAGREKAPAVELSSPSGELVLSVDTKTVGGVEGSAVYRVSLKGRTVLVDSALGLEFETRPLVSNLEITGTAQDQKNSTWRPVC